MARARKGARVDALTTDGCLPILHTTTTCLRALHDHPAQNGLIRPPCMVVRQEQPSNTSWSSSSRGERVSRRHRYPTPGQERGHVV